MCRFVNRHPEPETEVPEQQPAETTLEVAA
jgi:hypothetical protein